MESHTSWDARDRPAPGQTIEACCEGRPSRLQLVFLHTARAGAAPVLRLLEKRYGPELCAQHFSPPGPQHFDPGAHRFFFWLTQFIGRAFCVNFLMHPQDIGPVGRPIQFVTLVRHPLARLAGEFLAFRREVDARGNAGTETRKIAGDIVHFADAMMRNDYLVRFFSGMDVCDPIEEKDVDRARVELARLDVVGRHENPQLFARQLLSLDVFAGDEWSAARAAFAAEMSQEFRGPGDALASQLDSATRRQLERRNARDIALYDWIVSKLAK